MDNCATNANCAIWWSNLELMQVAPPVGQIWNQFWWHHLVVKFWTNTSGTTYNWPNLEPMQVALYLAGEITQVNEAIPWVRCASGNVFKVSSDIIFLFFCQHHQWHAFPFYICLCGMICNIFLCWYFFDVIIFLWQDHQWQGQCILGWRLVAVVGRI